MFIQEIFFKNFRNLEEQRIVLNPKFNFIFGKNAQGKTNIIESIYLLSFGRSFRTSEFRDLISLNLDAGLVNVKVRDGEIFYDLQARLTHEKKEFFKDNKRISSVSKSGRLTSVLFSPEETLLFKESPSARRDYLDKIICKLENDYEDILKNYQRVVLQRNKILGDENLNNDEKIDMLDSWNLQLISLGAEITKYRNKWINEINKKFPLQYEAIASNDKEARILYQPFVGEDAIKNNMIKERLEEALREKIDDEIARGQTLVGSQKDDFCVLVGTSDIKHFGSQGQHRSVVLALKMTEMELYFVAFGSYPIFLLDDVASELDEDRNKHFFEYLKNAKGQVFVTSTSLEDINIKEVRDFATLSVKNGVIQPS